MALSGIVLTPLANKCAIAFGLLLGVGIGWWRWEARVFHDQNLLLQNQIVGVLQAINRSGLEEDCLPGLDDALSSERGYIRKQADESWVWSKAGHGQFRYRVLLLDEGGAVTDNSEAAMALRLAVEGPSFFGIEYSSVDGKTITLASATSTR